MQKFSQVGKFFFFAEEHCEMAFTAHHPNGIDWSLIVTANLTKRYIILQGSNKKMLLITSLLK